jgi:uncharacterized protein YjbJ (UPF0337 family)
MDKNRIKGISKQVEGKIQEAEGKVTGSTVDKVKGAAKVFEGKVQESYGEGKDEARKSK